MSSSTAPAKDEVSDRVEIRLCGLPRYPNSGRTFTTLPVRCKSVRKHEKLILTTFKADADNYCLLWHLNTESCMTKRPFADLYRMPNGTMRGHEVVCFHLHCCIDPEKDPASLTLLAQAKQSDGREPDGKANGRAEQNVGTQDDGRGSIQASSSAGGTSIDQNGRAETRDYQTESTAADLDAAPVTRRVSARTSRSVQPSTSAKSKTATQPEALRQLDSSDQAEASPAQSGNATFRISWSTDQKQLLGGVKEDHTNLPIQLSDSL